MHERTILIVDDSPDIREVMHDLLTDAGYRVLLAANGKEALELLRSGREQVKLILLDLMMPVLDGWEFRKIQLADEALRGIPVVVITASQGLEVLQEPVAVLEKPVMLDVLLRTVSRYC